MENNGINGTGSNSGKGVVPSVHGVPDLAPAGRHEATDQAKQRMK